MPRWTLDLESEAAYLIPWLDSRPSPEVEAEVLAFINDRLLDWPWIEGAEDGETRVFSGYVAGITIAWLIDEARQVVVLVAVGDPRPTP